jgi:hypothetical protein
MTAWESGAIEVSREAIAPGVCEACGSLFDRLAGAGRPRKYCVSCAPARQRVPRSYKRKPKVERRCSECSGVFASSRPNQKTCSPECAYQRKKRREDPEVRRARWRRHHYTRGGRSAAASRGEASGELPKLTCARRV